MSKQAKQYNLPLQTELTRLLIHGIIHLCGFDHITKEEETEMLQQELKLLTLFSMDYIYS